MGSAREKERLDKGKDGGAGEKKLKIKTKKRRTSRRGEPRVTRRQKRLEDSNNTDTK